jgi:HSP20 family protein
MSSLIRWNPVYRTRPWRLVAPHWDSRVAMPLDIEENEDNYVIKASTPGFLPEDIEVQVEDSILTIRAEHHGDEEQEREGWYLRERFTGAVERQLRLGKNVNGENIEAELEHGVLTLTLPKVEEAKPKLIEIKVA